MERCSTYFWRPDALKCIVEPNLGLAPVETIHRESDSSYRQMLFFICFSLAPLRHRRTAQFVILRAMPSGITASPTLTALPKLASCHR